MFATIIGLQCVIRTATTDVSKEKKTSGSEIFYDESILTIQLYSDNHDRIRPKLRIRSHLDKIEKKMLSEQEIGM